MSSVRSVARKGAQVGPPLLACLLPSPILGSFCPPVREHSGGREEDEGGSVEGLGLQSLWLGRGQGWGAHQAPPAGRDPYSGTPGPCCMLSSWRPEAYCTWRGGDRCHPGQAHAHGPTLALAPPAGRGGLAGAPPASDSLLLQRQLWALALPLGSPSCPRHSGSPPGWPTHPPGWEYVPRDLGALSITSWSSSLVRAAFSLFCSLLSMRLTVGSWNLVISNKPAWLPKYSECWDFSTSLCS